MILAVLALLSPLPATAQSATDDLADELSLYPKDWLTERSARNGMDVTLDGKIWINADYYGDRDDHALAASDLYGATGTHRRAWVRGITLASRT